MKYYFVSDQNFDGQTLHPRVPENRAENHSENKTKKRICVSQSIDGCLLATYYKTGNKLYIHTCESDDVVTPTTRQVYDAPFTGEQWILKPVTMNLYMEIKLTKNICRNIGDYNLRSHDFEIIKQYKKKKIN